MSDLKSKLEGCVAVEFGGDMSHYETEDGNHIAENGINGEETSSELTTVVVEIDDPVVVDETLDTTIEDQLIEAEGNEEDEEQAEVDIEDDGDEADEAQGEGEEGQVQEEAVFEEEEQMDTADPEEPVDEAETQAVGGDDEENEGDALNISVEDNEVLGIDQDEKVSGEEDGPVDVQNEEETEATNDIDAEAEKADDGNNSTTSTSGKAESDNKPIEGEASETAEEAVTGKESERHIILVTGLSADTSANDLKTFFRKHGKIGRIKIMTNTRVPGSQRFAHISVPSLEELNYLVEKLNGVQLKGKSIRVAKAPEDGSVSRSYEIAVATAKAEADGEIVREEKSSDSTEPPTSTGTAENGKDSGKDEKVANGGDTDTGSKDATLDSSKKAESEKKKEEKKEEKKDGSTGKKTPEKGSRSENRSAAAAGHRSRRESHDRHNREHVRPAFRNNYRHDKDSTDWKRRGPARAPMEAVTRVHRDRPPMGRAPPPGPGGRRRSPHTAQLSFEQIREIRDEQRRREHERRKREEERERTAEVERQKRLEYQNYMEFKQLEKEREKLRLERERIEREKQELIKLERERQKAEREKIEREKEELRRAKLNIEHPRASGPVKRSYEDDKVRRRESTERKKPYVVERGRASPKTEAERKLERDRYERERLHVAHASDARSRSPYRASATSSAVSRDSRHDVWARDERDRPGRVRTRSDERSHRRETEAEKIAAAERRAREISARGSGGSSEIMSRHVMDSAHSSSRGSDTIKRPSDRYEDNRTSGGRDAEWIQRSYLTPTSSLSMPMSSSTSADRGSWPFAERKIEAWDSSRLTPRTEQWISGAGATVTGTGRSSLPIVAPPAPLYSTSAASLALQASGLGLGSYASADRYDGYRGGFHPLRKY